VAYNPLNLNAIAENFEVSRPAISQHIKILIECGIISIKQNGRERVCYVEPKPLKDVAEWAEQYRKLWSERFEVLDDVLRDMRREI